MAKADIRTDLAKYLCECDGQTWNRAAKGIASLHGTENDQEMYFQQADEILKFFVDRKLLKS